MKKVIGYKSLDALKIDLDNLEQQIRNDNEIPAEQTITWDNSKKTNKEEFARYYTYKHFFQKGGAYNNLEEETNKILNSKQ